MVDHTYLKQNATWEDIKKTCDEGMEFSCASVCIPPSYVRAAKVYVGDRIRICTVIGFPNGYSTTLTKCLEARDAIMNGADEIDMVINIGELKNKNYSFVKEEKKNVKKNPVNTVNTQNDVKKYTR